MMSKKSGLFDRSKKQFSLAILVLVIGVPVNYYLYSMWQSADASDLHVSSQPSGSQNSNNGLALLGELASENNHNHMSNSIAMMSGGNMGFMNESAVSHANKHGDPRYVCPMHSEIVTDDPDATCSICGMDLVVLDGIGESNGVVRLSSTVMNVLGVRTKKVKRRTIYRRIDSVGYVTYDEQKIRRVNLRTEGWIEKLNVKTVGERVESGDLLFQVYSPKLVNIQEEYLQALENSNGDERMMTASRDRLRALGISSAQIAQLNESKVVNQLISVFAPQDGVVIDLNIREGAFVPPSTSVVSLADLSSIWLMVDIFESQMDWVKAGQKAEAKLSFMPDKLWEGTVEYVYPMVDPKTRSVKARLRFDNVDELLKPNMYASVTIYAKPKRKVLTVPREAVIRSDSESRVIVALGEGRFRPAIVQIGIETSTKMEIVGGLREGQRVVVSSQFLIDSESSIRAALLRLAGG